MESWIKQWSYLSVLCFFTPQFTLQVTPASAPYYVGAVVEYHPIRSGKSAEAVAISNVDNFVKIIKKTKELNPELDIIVFPETGITTTGDGNDLLQKEMRQIVIPIATYVPDPAEKMTPCENNNVKVSKTLEMLSCAAKQYQTYIVVNHLEKEDCENCSDDNFNLYNSNIVFDRIGTIIGRYRKYNLFGESGTNITSEPELSTFDTDFGVKFGQFICFDILFRTPALQLIEKYNITDIVYSTHWFSSLPFADELQIQAAWSYANNVNLLASGFNNPASGSTGSGIYAGTYDKILGTFRSETDKNAVLIANVPKVINNARSKIQNKTILYEFSVDEVSTLDNELSVQNEFIKDDVSTHTTKLIEPDSEQNFTLCNNGFCCNFNHKVKYNMSVVSSGKKFYRYRFSAFHGLRKIENVGGILQICGLMTCKDDSLSSCGQRFDISDTYENWVTFEKLEISTLVPKQKDVTSYHMPISLQTNFRPLNPSDFSFKSFSASNYDFIFLSLVNLKKNLISFGIHGRVFSLNDG